MPLYTDGNYYYSGGSSQLYSPYYPGSSSAIPSSSNIYSPYSSTFNRSIGGSYVVPITPSRSPSYTSPHSLSASRYQPKLSTITETSPLISSSRHKTLMPLTRIQSPKYNSYATPNHVHTHNYIPPRPILINTADIDVSANRYRKRKEESLRQAQRESETSPGSSIKRRSSTERKEVEAQKLYNEVVERPAATDPPKIPNPEQHTNRSTIKRDRAVVRLSTIRSRSKNRKENKSRDSSPEPEKKFKDLPTFQNTEEVPKGTWREKLAGDLAAFSSFPNKKSPGEIFREKYLVQSSNNKEDYAANCKTERITAGLPKETITEVVVELGPLHHTVRRLSIPQCPTFHDICEDISSDKIDDDLNAGELRRRASIIQSQEQELLNELQKSASGTFQMIRMERRGSHDSSDEIPLKRSSNRSSKKRKKIRTKITAIVGVENAVPLGSILQENEEEFEGQKSPQPKFTVNVESVEEHQEIHKVFKLPKKKSIKKVIKKKERELPEGFMSSLPKPESSPKKKFLKSTADVFTFEEKECKQIAPTQTATKISEESDSDILTRETVLKNESPEAKILQFLDNSEKTTNEKVFKKSNSLNIEVKTPPETPNKKEVLQKSSSLNIEIKSPTLSKTENKKEHASPNVIVEPPKPENDASPNKDNTVSSVGASASKSIPNKSFEKSLTAECKTSLDQVTQKTEQKSVLKTSQSLDTTVKTETNKSLEKSNSLNIELKTPTTPKTEFIKEKPIDIKVATPKPIKKAPIKSDSGEDFWAQIGSRETLYMNKRKKEIVESQWKKREDLLESANEEEVKNLEQIKSLVTSQKMEALKKADDEQKTSKGVVGRSNSNESALKNKSPTKSKDEKNAPKEDKEAKTKIGNVSKISDNSQTNKKLEITTHMVSKIIKDTSLLTSPTSSPSSTVTKTFSTTTTSNTTTSPKIIGHEAKSPEQQESAEQNKIFPTSSAKNNNNKNEKDINKTTAINEKQQLAKTFTLPKENTKITSTTSVAIKSEAPEATTTKQLETKQVHQISPTLEKSNAVAKPKTTDTDKKCLADKKEQTNEKSPTHTKIEASPNADQFITKVPAKTNVSPVKTTKKTAAQATTPSATSSNIASTEKTSDKKKTTTTTSTNQTNSTDTATTTNIRTATNADDDNQQICTKIKDNISADTNTNNKGNDETNNSNTCGGNLSKFATVSNLAQCLHDVDADLADYLPSSAEISDNENYKTEDDSDFDYSSIDGWEKLTPSMKKKVKQRRRKEKQAEPVRFDPQKKVKIDTTRKLFVKEEAPRFPLVATPRPLWKREKIVYPAEDSDDESDSEESGSNEETEDSDECTTSEEYEDELNPRPSGSGGGVVKSHSGASGNGGVSDANKDSSIIRMSTCSNDSGFEGGTAPSSPKKMLETSYTYSQFQKSGRFTPPATIIPRFKNYSVEDFHFLAVLGKGSFGKVLLAELRDSTYYYAVKCLKKDVVLEDDDVDSTLIERKVLALGTKHPYLCHLFCTFQTESHLFFVMEYLNGGDLMFHIQESGRFTEERARFYGAEIVSGLKFLHKKGIIYRDLKLDNVLLDYEGHVRIADFGMCKLQIYLDKTADSFCGTPDYMAPEIIKGDKYNQNVDWWSFGVLLYEMLIGQSPFSGCDEDELFWSICNELPWFPVYISAEATHILKGLLEKDYTKRIGSQYSPAGDIVEHIFFRPIDWNLLEKRQIEPPFRPQVKHPLDTQYFDRVFTRERVRLTPIDKDILQSMDQKQFLGFTYTNPHITLD